MVCTSIFPQPFICYERKEVCQMSIPQDSQVFRTTTWSAGPGCHGGCGQKIYVKDGKMVYIEADETHPWNYGRSCPRALALKQYMYHENRITTPLLRVGRRGEGKWQPISWDEAYDMVERKFNAVKAEFGAESVIFVQGTGRDIGGPITLLCYSFGSPNWVQLGLSGHSCYTPRLGAMKAATGEFQIMDASQFLTNRYDDPRYKVPEVVITWGTDPIATCPDAFYGHWVVDCMKRGSKVIAVDPRKTWLSTRAEHHLQLRPGTDGALAIGMLQVIINENLHNQEFVAKWCHGFEDLKKRVNEYKLQDIAETTGVPVATIAAAARAYARAENAAIHWGLAVDMCPQGVTVSHAIACLWYITGNIDNPGGNVIARNAFGITTYPYTSEDLYELYGKEYVQKLNEKRIGTDKYAMLKNFRGWGHPDMTLEQIGTGKPYPIKAAWIQTANPIGGQAYDTRRHYEYLQKLDFIVCVDLFQTPTTMALADLILPAATFVEKDSCRTWWSPLCAIPKIVNVGECKSDWEINLTLARRFKPDMPWQTPRELFDARLVKRPDLNLTYDKLVEQGGWVMPEEGDPSIPYYRYEKGLLREDGQPGFKTPTGKIELYSTVLESWELDPLPFYEEPKQSPVSTPELYSKYPLIMISGTRSPLYFHSEHRMIPWLREKEPWPCVELHPETAKKYGVYDGEWVWIENDQGRAKRKVKISLKVTPNIINTGHSWWMPEMRGEEPDLFGVWDYQINQLIPGPQASDAGFGGGQYKVTLVKIGKIKD